MEVLVVAVEAETALEQALVEQRSPTVKAVHHRSRD
jgi:hypothetical protein